MRSTRRWTAVLCSFALAGCSHRIAPADGVGAPGGNDTETAGFIVRLGNDTIFAERFSRRGADVTGDIINRSPTTTVTHYSLTSDAAGRITRLTVNTRAPDTPSAARPLWSIEANQRDGGLDVTMREGETERRRFVADAADALLLFDRSVPMYELAARRLRAGNRDTLDVPVIELDSISLGHRRIERLGPDSVVFRFIFPRGEHARVDAAGRVLGISGLATSYKWLTERVGDLDVAAMTASFAKRDATGGFGNLSSRDTSRAVIGDAHVTVDYGRPSKRGRVIFGGLVPWGEVWRTGADLATHFTTDRAIRFGGPSDGLVVPAGTYTLYTIPAQTGWTLIVNRRTGQSGLQYEPEADLGRVAMVSRPLGSVVERLTISASGTGNTGLLRIAWDTLEVSIPFAVVP